VLDGQAKEVAVPDFDAAVLNLDRAVECLNGGGLWIDDDDSGEAG